MEKIDNLEVKLGIWKEQNGSIVEKGVDVLLATDIFNNIHSQKTIDEFFKYKSHIFKDRLANLNA